MDGHTVNEAEKRTEFLRIRDLYDQFVVKKKEIRASVHEEVERLAAERVSEVLVGLSAEVRRAYAAGVPKTVLREAVRAYSNVAPWNLIWDAAEDTVPVVNRGSLRKETPSAMLTKPFEFVTEDPKDQGAKFIEAGKRATLRVLSGPDGVAWDTPVEIPLVRKALRGPWAMPAGEEWYEIDDETGMAHITDSSFEDLSLWGSDWQDVIRTIEAEYTGKGKGK